MRFRQIGTDTRVVCYHQQKSPQKFCQELSQQRMGVEVARVKQFHLHLDPGLGSPVA